LSLLVACDSESTREATEKAKQTASDAIAKSRELGRGAVARGKTLVIHGKEWSAQSFEELRDFGAELVDQYGDDINASGARIDELLLMMARDPDAQVTAEARAGRMIILMIPFVGPTKRFADARALHDAARDAEDEAKLQQARRECLLACAEAGLDIGTLGLVGSHADLVATGVNHVFTTLKVTRNLNALLEGDLVILDRFLDGLLAHEAIQSGIDRALMTDLSTIVPRQD